MLGFERAWVWLTSAREGKGTLETPKGPPGEGEAKVVSSPMVELPAMACFESPFGSMGSIAAEEARVGGFEPMPSPKGAPLAVVEDTETKETNHVALQNKNDPTPLLGWGKGQRTSGGAAIGGNSADLGKNGSAPLAHGSQGRFCKFATPTLVSKNNPREEFSVDLEPKVVSDDFDLEMCSKNTKLVNSTVDLGSTENFELGESQGIPKCEDLVNGTKLLRDIPVENKNRGKSLRIYMISGELVEGNVNNEISSESPTNGGQSAVDPLQICSGEGGTPSVSELFACSNLASESQSSGSLVLYEASNLQNLFFGPSNEQFSEFLLGLDQQVGGEASKPQSPRNSRPGKMDTRKHSREEGSDDSELTPKREKVGGEFSGEQWGERTPESNPPNYSAVVTPRSEAPGTEEFVAPQPLTPIFPSEQEEGGGPIGIRGP